MSRHSARGAVWDAQRLRVLNRDGWQCAYCHEDIAGANATVDHRTPISLSNDKEYNDEDLVSACRSCNGRKQDKAALRVSYLAPGWFT